MESFAEQQLREISGVSEGKNIAPSVRLVLGRVFSPQMQHAATQGQAQQQMKNLQDFAKAIAQGVQWGHEQYPHVAGPSDILFGLLQQGVVYKGKQYPMKLNTRLITLHNEERECFIIAPALEAVEHIMQDWRRGKKTSFQAKARQVLGELTMEEWVFLNGVEEALHAVQRQDPALREKYPLDPVQGAQRTALIPAPGEHDSKQSELDIVAPMQKALGEFRKRREEELSRVKQ